HCSPTGRNTPSPPGAAAHRELALKHSRPQRPCHRLRRKRDAIATIPPAPHFVPSLHPIPQPDVVISSKILGIDGWAVHSEDEPCTGTLTPLHEGWAGRGARGEGRARR